MWSDFDSPEEGQVDRELAVFGILAEAAVRSRAVMLVVVGLWEMCKGVLKGVLGVTVVSLVLVVQITSVLVGACPSKEKKSPCHHSFLNLRGEEDGPLYTLKVEAGLVVVARAALDRIAAQGNREAGGYVARLTRNLSRTRRDEAGRVLLEVLI